MFFEIKLRANWLKTTPSFVQEFCSNLYYLKVNKRNIAIVWTNQNSYAFIVVYNSRILRVVRNFKFSWKNSTREILISSLNSPSQVFCITGFSISTAQLEIHYDPQIILVVWAKDDWMMLQGQLNTTICKSGKLFRSQAALKML